MHLFHYYLASVICVPQTIPHKAQVSKGIMEKKKKKAKESKTNKQAKHTVNGTRGLVERRGSGRRDQGEMCA